MTKQYDLWGDEIPEEPPKPPKKKYKKPAPLQFVREPTDIIEWLGMNAPSSSQALRQALYTQQDSGDYRVQYAGEDRFRLFGPHSKVLIVSDKARHYLLRSLCRYRQFNGF